MPITPQQARAELARRELARRGVSLEQPIQEQPQTAMQMPREEFMQLPYWQRFKKAGIEPFISEIASPLAHFGSALAADIPETIIKKYFPQAMPPEQQTVIGKIARGAGEALGFGMGLPTKAGIGATRLATKAIPRLAGQRLIPSAIRGAIGGAIGMGTITPKEGLLAPQKRLQQAGTGAILGGITGAITSQVTKFSKWLKPQNQLGLAEETRNSLIGQKHNLVEKYGDVYNRTIKQGQGQISLQEPLLNLIDESDDIVNTIKGNAEISEALAKGEPNAKRIMNIVNSFIENPKAVDNLSLQEADSLQKYIKNLPSIRGKLARSYKVGFEQVDFTNADRILLNFANDIKAKVLNLAPEMSLVNKEYSKFMTNYKQIRPYLKWNNAVTNIKNLHRLDPAILEKFQQMLPQNLLNNILQMNRTIRNAELLKRIGAIGAGGAIAGTGGKIGWEILRKK